MILKHKNIFKNATGKGDDYRTGSLLDYTYLKDNYKMTPIDLSKQHSLDADLRAIQQINFTADLDRTGNTKMLFIIEKAKETVLNFSQGTEKILLNSILLKSVIEWFNFYQYKITQYNSLNVISCQI